MFLSKTHESFSLEFHVLKQKIILMEYHLVIKRVFKSITKAILHVLFN